MFSKYALFQTAVDLAHHYWERLVKPGDTVIDATCGNGLDTLKLAQLVGPQGKVHAFDVQEKAITATRERLGELLPRVELHHASHEVLPHYHSGVRLIVYNLGFLPGGDKTFTTQTASTVNSLEQAVNLILPGGVISVTLYPGHEEGAREADAILAFAGCLRPQEWSVCLHTLVNRRQAPSLLLLQRATSPISARSSFSG